ncbi:MAG: hypothetical protein Q9187_003455, partial [Circinaria calcarea]
MGRNLETLKAIAASRGRVEIVVTTGDPTETRLLKTKQKVGEPQDSAQAGTFTNASQLSAAEYTIPVLLVLLGYMISVRNAIGILYILSYAFSIVLSELTGSLKIAVTPGNSRMGNLFWGKRKLYGRKHGESYPDRI